MIRPPATADERRNRWQQDHAQQLAVQLQRDAMKLGTLPEFHRYMAHILFGRLGLKKDPWRPNAGETARAAARTGAASEILGELHALDPACGEGVEQAHLTRQREERELAAAFNQEHRP